MSTTQTHGASSISTASSTWTSKMVATVTDSTMSSKMVTSLTDSTITSDTSDETTISTSNESLVGNTYSAILL